MARNLSAQALAKIAEKVGTEPINIIEIDWVSGTTAEYADKTLEGIPGKILSLSSLDEVIQLSEGMSTAQISITLDDTDGTIKTLMNQYDLHKRQCRVYQHFDGMDIEDRFELFRGEVASPIVWSEGSRTVSFQVISQIRSYEVGFSPDQGQYNFVQYDLSGIIWPLCFGSPIHVPAARSNQVKTGTLMATIGIPDPTLPLKRDLLEYRLEQIKEAYAQYIKLIAEARNIARSPFVIQKDLATNIIFEDNLKQMVEDNTIAIDQLNLKIDRKIKEYGDAFDDAEGPEEIKSKIEDLVAQRNDFVEALKSYNQQLLNIKHYKSVLKIEAANAKYEITVVNKLRKRCRDLKEQYIKFYREWTNVVEIVGTQQRLGAEQTSVMNGYTFPQNNTTLIDVNGVTFNGLFDGYSLALSAPQPNYRNVLVGPRESEDISTFWIQDASLELAGKYLRLANGRIVKVTQQDGKKCIIDLPPKKKKQRTQKRDIEYKPDEPGFDDLLNRVLIGNETQEQIARIAACIPTKINDKIMNMLRGPRQTFVITCPVKPQMSSTYRIAFGAEQVTEPITVTDDEVTIRDKIANSIVGVTSSAFEVEIKTKHGNDAFKRIEITGLDPRMPEMHITDVQLVKQPLESGTPLLWGYYDIPEEDIAKTITVKFEKPDSWKNKYNAIPGSNIDIEFATLSGTLNIFINGKMLTYQLEASTEVNDNGEPEFDEIEITGEMIMQDAVQAGALDADSTGLSITGSLDPVMSFTTGENRLVFEITNANHSVMIQHAGSVYVYGTVPEGEPRAGLTRDILLFDFEAWGKRHTVFYLDVDVEGNMYASEYTKKQREKKLDDDLEKDINSPALEVYKGKLQKLMKSKADQQINGTVDNETEQAIQSAMATFASAVSKAKIDDSAGQKDAYRLLSDDEQELLLQLEQTAYIEWRNEYQELDKELKDEDQYEFTALDITDTIQEASTIIHQEWVDWINGLDKHEKAFETELLPNNTVAFIGSIGDKVVLTGLYQEKFVANILPSTILSVYAYRNIDGLRQFVPVPSSYYVKNEADYYGSLTCTTVTLARPLSTIDAGWEDQIYVTLTSSVGPNVVDVIQWIVEHYTNLQIDTASFAEVWNYQINYPVNFAILDRQDSLQVIRNIAYQARCNIWMKLGKVFIRYMPEEPPFVNSITEEHIEEKSFELTFTPSEEIITKLTASWRPHYAIDNPWKVVVARNVKIYGEYAEEREFYIYNDRTLVYKSATWWLIQWASTYKYARFRVFLDQLNLETYDCIELALNNNPFCNTTVNGIIRKADYDSNSHSIQLEVWLPVLSGQMEKYKFAWLSDLTVNDVFPPPEDIVAGNAGNPINQLIPTGTAYDPLNDNDFNFRPQDYGKPDMSDLNDELPKNPATAFYELDYQKEADEPVEISDDSDSEKEKDSPEWDGMPSLSLQSLFGGPDQQPGEVGLLFGRLIDYYPDETFTNVDVFGTIIEDDKEVKVKSVKVLLENGATIKAYIKQYDDTNSVKYPLESRVIVSWSSLMRIYEIIPSTYVDPVTNQILPQD